MNILINFGILLEGVTILADRYIKSFPNWLAIVLDVAAVILMIAGMIVSKHTVHT